MTPTIPEVEARLRQVERPPYGFFVSRVLYDAMLARWRDTTSPAASPLAPSPSTYAGVQLALDPDLADAELVVAQTEAAWRERLAAIKSRTNSRTDAPQLVIPLKQKPIFLPD